jgi:hypothetical protein
VNREDQEAFEWAVGLNPKPEGIVQHGMRLLRGGAHVTVEDDIEAKRKRRERAEKGIITVGGL